MASDIFSLSIDNSTLLHIAPAWVSSPPVRGTSDILYTCLFTLSLCVWTSIHLDITPGRGEWLYTSDRALHMFGAMVLPEFVLFTAFNEWFAVRQLCKSLNILAKEHNASVCLTFVR